MSKTPPFLSLLFCILGCADEKIVNVPGPVQIVYTERSALPLEFNVYARLLYDQGGYYVTWLGNVKNTGQDTLRGVLPQAKIFFSEEAMRSDNPAVVAQ